ncbi:MAG: PH domain-containing protein [Pacificimonas sp.]
MTTPVRWTWAGEPLPTNYRTMLYVQAFLSLLMFGISAAAAIAIYRTSSLDLPLDPMPFLAVLIAFALLRAVIQPWRLHASWRFQAEDEELRLKRGVLTKVETLVPFSRVQHIDVERGPMERIFGLARLVVHTAGTRGASVTLPGLLPERAEALRREIREELKRQESADVDGGNAC